jgi:hypothetical protein
MLTLTFNHSCVTSTFLLLVQVRVPKFSYSFQSAYLIRKVIKCYHVIKKLNTYLKKTLIYVLLPVGETSGQRNVTPSIWKGVHALTAEEVSSFPPTITLDGTSLHWIKQKVETQTNLALVDVRTWYISRKI